ncbi:DUF2070 family protein [Haloarchaeobius litoreus]|uniref:DUF2070 family protein n=1 Tax=Haloarchaeobius litoreus TaxID=755306 RepID=A0ABD6DI89_9EURY|nr:DUF2070 family protein [Haloarchaeobius litoreus]
MTTTQGDLASLSRYIFRAPQWYTSLAFAMVVAGVTGVGVFDDGFFLEGFTQGIFFIGVPTVVASLLTGAVDQRLGGQLTAGRSSLLALLCEILVVVFLAVGGVVALVGGFGQNFVFDVLYAGLASIFALRLLIVAAVSSHSIPRAAVPASIQTVAAAALLFVYSGTSRYLEVGGPLVQAYLSRAEHTEIQLSPIVPGDFVILGLVCLLYGSAVWLFLVIIDRPWKRSLGVSVRDFLGGFIGHIAEDSRELETFFEELGEEALVPVTVLGFRRGDGSEKARAVLPMVHPGPMGEIGGGNLPERVARATEGMALPPHATAGHDFNLVTEREVDTIVETAAAANDALSVGGGATRSVRTTSGDAKLLAQAFGDDILLVNTHSPRFADDVDYAVGLSAVAEARSGGFDEALLVDAHNCNNGLRGDDLGHVTPGSERSFDIMEAARKAAEELHDAERNPFELGVAWEPTDWEPEDGIGPLGVRVACVDVADEVTAYVLVDGNNMEPGVRERLIDGLPDAVDRAEVMTTDTHVVNRVESSNQVGEALDVDELVELVADLADRALADREPVEAGMATERARVTVFGNDRTETLASHANAMVSMGGALAVLLTMAAMGLSVVVFLLS